MDVEQEVAELEARLAAARCVAERYPDATLEVLWDGGPKVYVSPSARPHATRVIEAPRKSLGTTISALLPYAVLEGEGFGEVRVFAGDPWRCGEFTFSILEEIRRKRSKEYEMIVSIALGKRIDGEVPRPEGEPRG